MLVVIRAAFFKGVSAKGKFSNPMIFNKRFYSWDSCGIFESPKGVANHICNNLRKFNRLGY
jgi:hypothetical protein